MAATTSAAPPARAGRPSRQISGESGIWVFAILDMLIFAELFGIFGWYRAGHLEAFRDAQSNVIPLFGLAYTMILLSSSWFVALGIGAVRKGQRDLADKMIKVGVALGAGFVVVKFIEYGLKFASGLDPLTNDFFMFFFVMTFFHLLHALGGLCVLTYMRRRIRVAPPRSVELRTRDIRVIESCAIYWHMVDLLWIVLFALFYLRG